MVVTNRLFHIISIFFLVIGVILSTVGITLIIVSSSTECTPASTTTASTPSVSATTVSPSECPPQTCHSTMFGAQVPVANYPWDNDLQDPNSPTFKQLSEMVSTQIISALMTSPQSKMSMLISTDAIVTYDVQVTRFMKDGEGTMAYTSGVALSTAPIESMPNVTDIQTTLNENLPEETPVVVNGPAYECPTCSCPTMETTECPTVLPSDCPPQDCSVCSTETTECPSISCPSTSPPNTTECPTVSPFDCSSCSPEVITTECPSHPTPPPIDCNCPSTQCPSLSSTGCPTVIPSDCPSESNATECPLVTCPTSSSIELSTECPTIIPSDCPSTDCPVCPPEVITTECPSFTISNTTECPVRECTTSIPTDCPTVTSSDPPPDCSLCPSQVITTECPSISCPTLIPSECPVTECPSIPTTECPPSDCTMCPGEGITTECPSLTSSPSNCPAVNTTDCPTVIPTDCPPLDCTLCSTDGTESPSCPPLSPTECPSTPSIPSTDCPSTNSPYSLTCQSTIFGAQVSLVETAWDTQLENPDSDEFKEKADYVSKLLMDSLEGSMMILSSNDIKVTYNVQVDRFSPGREGTIAYTSGVAMSTAPIEDIPSVSDIRATFNSTLGEETVIVENNELEFCSSYLFPPSDLSTSSRGTTVEQTTQSTPFIPHSTSQEEEITQTTHAGLTSTQVVETTHPSTSIPHSTSQESESTHTSPTVTQSTIGDVETTEHSPPMIQTTSHGSETTDTTHSVDKSTVEDWESSPSTSIHHSSSLEPQITQSTSFIPESTTEAETTQSSSPFQSTSQLMTQPTSSIDQTTSNSENIISTTQQIPQSSTQEDETTQSSTPINPSTSEESNETQSSTLRSTTREDSSTVSSPSPSDRSTTEELNRSSPQSSTPSLDHSSTSSFSSSMASESSVETTPIEFSPTSTKSSLSTTEESVHSSSPYQSVPSTTTTLESSTSLPSQTSTKPTEMTTESLTTLPSTIPSTSQVWTSPSTVACSGREVINGDVYLLFDYTLFDGSDDETMGIENFITDILFSFDGNHFFLGRDPNNGAQPLRFFLIHYPTDDANPYSTLLAKDITSLDQLKKVMGLINQIPNVLTESRMKEALDAIYAVSDTNNPQSIVLISKSDEFVDEAISIANQLEKEKKFNIIGVPLNGINLTPLTNYADLPLDVNSIDAQMETAADIDSLLMSISRACLPSTLPPPSSTMRLTTPSTTKPTTTTTSSSCDSSLSQLSIAFVYQANGGIGDNPTLNSDIVDNILSNGKMNDPTSYTAFFPFPHTKGYSSTAAYSWMPFTFPNFPLIFNILTPSKDEIGATISDGLQSLIDHPDTNDGIINNIVVIIANSADDVVPSQELADQLKKTSTIITLSYGGEFHLSPLASSPQFVLTQTSEDSNQAASLLFNSILQATCT